MIRKLYNSFFWSCEGLYACFQKEKSFRIEVALLFFTMALSFIINLTFVQILTLMISVIFIMIIELLNSAVEKLADFISKDIHPVIKYVKDVGSAAVFLSLFIYFMIWGYILCL